MVLMLLMSEGTNCGLCQREEETVLHLFSSCEIAWEVWMRICRWLGISSVLQQEPKSLFLQFVSILGHGKNEKIAATMFWIAAIGALWSHWNKVVFNGVVVDIDNILELIQFKVWLWMKSLGRSFHASNSDWLLNPICCIKSL